MLNNNNYGVGRFICDHPFITMFIIGDICGVIKWAISMNAAKKGVHINFDGNNYGTEEETEAE